MLNVIQVLVVIGTEQSTSGPDSHNMGFVYFVGAWDIFSGSVLLIYAYYNFWQPHISRYARIILCLFLVLGVFAAIVCGILRNWSVSLVRAGSDQIWTEAQVGLWLQ